MASRQSSIDFIPEQIAEAGSVSANGKGFIGEVASVMYHLLPQLSTLSHHQREGLTTSIPNCYA